MKIAIAPFSKIADGSCISALRFTGSCDTCDRVMKCELPEAREGRIKLFEDKIDKAKEYLKKLEERRFQEVKEGLRENTP